LNKESLNPLQAGASIEQDAPAFSLLNESQISDTVERRVIP